MRSRLPLLLLTLCTLWLSACDSVDTDGETIFVTEGVEARFEFSADDAEVGRLLDLTERGLSVDLPAGFTTDDVVAVTVDRAVFEVLFPLNENVDFVRSGVLKVITDDSDLTALEIAELTSFPSGEDEVAMQSRGRNLASFVVEPTFGLVLQIEPRELEAGEDYLIAVTLDLRIELEDN